MYLYILLMIASLPCFHSINIPSEWELDARIMLSKLWVSYRFHSINIPSEWELLGQINAAEELSDGSFHSINIPSEWE